MLLNYVSFTNFQFSTICRVLQLEDTNQTQLYEILHEENSYINNKVLQKDLQSCMWDSAKNLWWSFLIKIVNGVYPKQALMM